MMVGTRDRVPHGIGLSSEISAGILGRRGPRTRSYPFSSVSGFQGSRGVLSAPPRRFLPSAAQGDILRAPHPAVKGESRLFPGKGRLRGLFSPYDLGRRASIALRAAYTFPPYAQEGGAGGENATLHLGALRRRGAPRRREIPSALRRRPLLCKEAGRLSCAQPLK